jgi:ribosome-associated protein
VNAQALARAVARLTLTKKASDVLVMDLRGLTSMADYFVICSADSDTQVKAIADGVEEGMDAVGVNPWHIESGSTNWILLDFVDVVLHVFHKSTRPFYSLEKLWGDAKIVRVSEETSLGRKPARPNKRKVAKTSKTNKPKRAARRKSTR